MRWCFERWKASAFKEGSWAALYRAGWASERAAPSLYYRQLGFGAFVGQSWEGPGVIFWHAFESHIGSLDWRQREETSNRRVCSSEQRRVSLSPCSAWFPLEPGPLLSLNPCWAWVPPEHEFLLSSRPSHIRMCLELHCSLSGTQPSAHLVMPALALV